MEKNRKSVKIWQNYCHEFVAWLFWPTLYLRTVQIFTKLLQIKYGTLTEIVGRIHENFSLIGDGGGEHRSTRVKIVIKYSRIYAVFSFHTPTILLSFPLFPFSPPLFLPQSFYFYQGRYASAVCLLALWPCVHLSACHTRTPRQPLCLDIRKFATTGRIVLLFGKTTKECFLSHIPHCVTIKFGYT